MRWRSGRSRVFVATKNGRLARRNRRKRRTRHAGPRQNGDDLGRWASATVCRPRPKRADCRSIHQSTPARRLRRTPRVAWASSHSKTGVTATPRTRPEADPSRRRKRAPDIRTGPCPLHARWLVHLDGSRKHVLPDRGGRGDRRRAHAIVDLDPRSLSFGTTKPARRVDRECALKSAVL